MTLDVHAIQGAFGLGGDVRVVAHHAGASGVWRVRSATGDFAVKLLPRQPAEWRRTTLLQQERLETAAWNAGVAMPEPVPVRGAGVTSLTAEIAGYLVQVHHWVHSVPNGGVTEPDALADWLGQTLAVLHRLIPLDVWTDDDLRVAYGIHPPSDWQAWIQQGLELRLPWANAAGEALEVVEQVTDLSMRALADSELPRCLTHRDVNPANVIHSRNGPVLCDFAYAGPDIAWLEAVSTAVSFGVPHVLSAYGAAGGAVGPSTDVALARHFGSRLNWVAFTMWLSLGHRDVSPAERSRATARVSALIDDLVTESERLDHLRARYLL